MTKKPILLNVIPMVLIVIAMSFYFQIVYLLHLDIIDISRVLSHITLPNWLTIFCLIATSICLYKGNSIAKIFMPLTVAVVVWNNYLVSSYAHNFSMLQTLLGSLSIGLLFVPLYSKKYQSILSDKRRHWWDCESRMEYRAPVTVNPFIRSSFMSRSYDVSKSGIFVEIDPSSQLENLPKVGERVNINIALDTLRKIRCEAVVVRISEKNGKYPRGMGLKFTELNPESRRTLNHFFDH